MLSTGGRDDSATLLTFPAPPKLFASGSKRVLCIPSSKQCSTSCFINISGFIYRELELLSSIFSLPPPPPPPPPSALPSPSAPLSGIPPPNLMAPPALEEDPLCPNPLSPVDPTPEH